MKPVPIFRMSLVREGSVRDYGCARGPYLAAEIAAKFLEDRDRECFIVLLQNAQLDVIGVHMCQMGTVDGSVANVKEVFKAALLANACSVITAHNHPSGDLSPSEGDRRISRLLREAGKTLDIDVNDFVITNSDREYLSFKEKGWL